MESSNNSEIYDTLVRIKNGEEIPTNHLERLDNLIYSYKFNSSSPGKSLIRLDFNDEDYWGLFDLTDDDIWFASNIYSYYSGFEIESYDTSKNDWDEGYLIKEFSDENLSKVSDILKLISPEIYKLRNDDEYHRASKILSTMFERQVDNIISEYNTEKNNCLSRSAQDMIESESCNVFQTYGIFSKNCYNKYFTTVSILLAIYSMVKDTSLSIYDVLKYVGHNFLSVDGGWYEFMYDLSCDDFDKDSFNRNVEYQLEKMMDMLLDDEDYVDLKTFMESVIPILDKYDINVWYDTPKDRKISFKISEIDTEKQVIVVEVSKNREIESRSYSADDFNLLLYHPELF